MVSQIQKKLCIDCKVRFDVEWNDLEEGDAVTCPGCNLEYTIIADKKGILKLVESKEVEMEDEDEEVESDDSDSEDVDSD